MRSELNNIPPTFVPALRETLSAFLNRCGELADANGNVPASTSQATQERTDSQRPESIVSAWSVASLLIENSADHISLFVKSIDEPIESLACWTSIRSMMEPCSIAAWLLDPQIDARARVSRVFALRYEGLTQQQKFARSINQPDAEIQKIGDRINDVEQAAVNLGYSTVLDRNGRRIGIGERMPGATDIIGDQLDDESTYRLLSAVAHGQHWAVRQLGFHSVDSNDNPDSVGNVPTQAFERTVNVNGIAFLGLHGALAFAHTLWNQYHYFGWNPDSIEELFERTFDRLSFNDSMRFWRSLD